MMNDINNIDENERQYRDLKQAYQSLFNNVLVTNKLLAQEDQEEDILSLLLSLTRLIIDFESGTVLKIENDEYKNISSMDVIDEFQTFIYNYIREGIYTWAMKQKRTLVMPEGEKNSHILVPVFTERDNIGILHLKVRDDADNIKNQDLDLLHIIATNTATRCDQVRLNRWSGLVDVLLSTIEKVNSSDKIDDLFDFTLKGLNQLLGCSNYLLLLGNENNLTIKARYDDGLPYCIALAYKKNLQCLFVNDSLANNESVIKPNLNLSSRCNECPLLSKKNLAETHLMVVPLDIKASENHGAIVIADFNYNSKLLKDDSIRIVKLFANQVSIAISQTQLRTDLELKNTKINKELKTAETVQKSLLPSVKEKIFIEKDIFSSLHISNTDLEVTGFYLPSSALGGDFYDIIPFDDNFFFSIADVSGHGLSSSLITALYKMALHKFVSDKSEYLPDQISTLINNDLHKFIKTGDFVTAIIGKYNKSTSEISFSSAGHPYPLHYVAQKQEIKFLNANGSPLAALANQDYPLKLIKFNSGDKLFLYTDGITESVNSKCEMFKKDRLSKIITENASLSSPSLIKLIYKELKKFTGSNHFNDDITILLIDKK